MKITLLTLFIAFTLTAFGQNSPNTPYAIFVDFEYFYDSSSLSVDIDTTNADNIWQIGQPQKTVLNQAESLPNVLITDTINTYPVNNTSSFVVSYQNWNCGEIHGSYFCDTDSLNDYGMIELSTDFGQTWVNLTDSIHNNPNLTNLNLTGNSNGWKQFYISFHNYINQNQEDSLLVKFTFISDSIDTQHDGLMFDNLVFCIAANTQNLYQLNNLKVFPNPTSDILNFEFEELIDNGEIRIYSSIGQLMDNQKMSNTDVQFDVSNWQTGMYYYGIFVENEIVKQGQVLIQD